MSRERVSWIAHEGLAIQDPITSDQLDLVVRACAVAPSDLAVDLGCGTGELLARIVERWHCRGIGIDRSEEAIRRARLRSSAVEWQVADAKDHGLHDGDAALVASIGATHAFGSLTQTLDAIVPLVRTGGLVVVGDGYWRTDPSDEWLAALGATRDELADRESLIATIEAAGLDVETAVDASSADVDAYNDAWRANLERRLAAHPDGPDRADIEAALADARRWHGECGRYLGFAIVVTRRR